MEVRITTRIAIAASPDRVFEYLADLKYHHLWNPQVFSISTTKRLAMDSTFETESRVIGLVITAVNRVVGFEPPNELVIENSAGNVLFTALFRLHPRDNVTLVRLTTTLSTNVLLHGITLPVLKQLASRELQADLKALKIAVENGLE